MRITPTQAAHPDRRQRHIVENTEVRIEVETLKHHTHFAADGGQSRTVFNTLAGHADMALLVVLKQATQAQALTANPSPLIGAAIIYVAFLWPMVVIVARLEKRFSAGRRR